MNFLVTRNCSLLRGPLGQHLPWNVSASQKIIPAVSANLSAFSCINGKAQKQSLLTQQVSQLEAFKRQMSSNHVTLWTAERALSAVMIPVIPLAFLMPSATMDYILAFTFAVHSHWGIEAIVYDYVRPSIFGEIIPKIAIALVYGISTMTLGGLFYFVYADVGIVNAIKMLWKL